MKRFKRVPQGFQAVRRLDLRMDLFLNVPDLAIYGLKVIGNRLLYCLLKHAGLQLVDLVKIVHQLVIALVDPLLGQFGLVSQESWPLEETFEDALVAAIPLDVRVVDGNDWLAPVYSAELPIVYFTHGDVGGILFQLQHRFV